MVQLTTKTPVRFTPDWLAKAKQKPVYLLRSGSVTEREEFEAMLAGSMQAAQIFPSEWTEAFREGVTALLDPADADRLASLYEQDAAEQIDALREDRDAEQLPPSDKALVNEAVQVLTKHWPGFAALVDRQARRRRLMPVAAFRQFCVGWEGVDAEFATGPDGCVAETALKKISSHELKVAGIRAYGLLYARGEEKN